jgi:hypothetical protein
VGKVSKLQESWKGEEMKGKGKLLVPPKIEMCFFVCLFERNWRKMEVQVTSAGVEC